MFDTILIANRGEIACRVMETAQAMGVRCVAVYSDADRAAKHVAMADTAVHIGGSAPADSYLRGEVIIQAALDTGAQAIHPGYGFLSENPHFVDAVEAAGLVFIGPSAKAIRAMGLKVAAKALMVEAGVPVVPGYHGADQDDALLAAEADKIGYPVLIKAVAGGGGKGMRLVEAADGFQAALESARSEAKTAFGNADVLVEKFVTKPRHIEVQVFGDGKKAVHLFERDCSLQRRHQKVLEEAPSPVLGEEDRMRMGEVCSKAMRDMGYRGAGTIEFLWENGEFYFIEMNTRLQVEHPVTEMITGIDLVREQIRIAAGKPLSVTQDEVEFKGHAIECRINAEDPFDFTPSPGKITYYHAAGGMHVRVDSGLYAGYSIPPYYDSMIAKLIVYGRDRERCMMRLKRALEEMVVEGVKTSIPLHQELLQQDDVKSGNYSIKWLEEWLKTRDA